MIFFTTVFLQLKQTIIFYIRIMTLDTMKKEVNGVKANGSVIVTNPHFLPRERVPTVMWEIGILHGYRPVGKPWNYYIRSMFWIHNETGNIWTHLLSPLYAFVLIYCCSLNTDFRTNISAHGFLVYNFSCVIMYLTSATAHLVHSKSEITHYVLYSLDYSTIALFGYGTGIMLYYSSGNEKFYSMFGGFFPIALTFSALYATIGMVIARTVFDKRDIKRKLVIVSSLGPCFIVAQIPLIFRLYECAMETDPALGLCLGENLCVYFVSFIFSVICALSYSLHLPERAFPGKFDVFGLGHQWFHMAVNCGVTTLGYAGLLDLLTMPQAILRLANPDVQNIWLGFAGFMFTNIIVLTIIFYKYAASKASAKKEE